MNFYKIWENLSQDNLLQNYLGKYIQNNNKVWMLLVSIVHPSIYIYCHLKKKYT